MGHRANILCANVGSTVQSAGCFELMLNFSKKGKWLRVSDLWCFWPPQGLKCIHLVTIYDVIHISQKGKTSSVLDIDGLIHS